MKTRTDPLELPVPRDRDGLMLLLQTLVAKGYLAYCAGVIAPAKLEGLLRKFAARYPLGRDTRARTYDRSKGLAAVQFTCYPVDGGIAWFLLSTEGSGGLLDPGGADRQAGAVREAMVHDQHLRLGEYVLLYAHKKEARTVRDKRTGRDKTLWKDTSTWTWRLDEEAMGRLKTGIREMAKSLKYGDPGTREGHTPWGLRGLLAEQRRRPLFAGVRSQLIELQRYAHEVWDAYRHAWLKKYPEARVRYGANAGQLMPMTRFIQDLPKLTHRQIYDSPAATMGRALTTWSRSA